MNIIELPCKIGDYMLITNNIVSYRPKIYIGKVEEIHILKDNEIWVTTYYNGEEDNFKVYGDCKFSFIGKRTAEILSEFLSKGEKK